MQYSSHLKIKVYNLNKALFKKYGKQGWWPTISEAGKAPVYYPGQEGRVVSDKECFEIIVGSILTQNTSWSNVEKALINLSKENFIDLGKIAKANNDLETLIKPAGYFNQKAQRLRVIADNIIKIGGIKALRKMPTRRLRDLLLSWKGIGPETADSILCYALNKPVFVVDNYTKRLFSKIDILFNSYDQIQDLVHQSIAPQSSVYGDFHARIVNLFKKKEVEEFLLNFKM